MRRVAAPASAGPQSQPAGARRAASPMVRISHVIYDLDGLLLDTEPFYTQASQVIARRFGKDFDWSLKARMMGRKASEAARTFVEALDLPLTPEAYLEERRALLEAWFPGAAPMPGARRLTRHLHRHGIPQAVATSSERRLFELKIRRHRPWFRIFAGCITGDDPEVRHAKPAPDIFLVAARRLGAEPARCLVFEDAPAGVQAALAAGMYVVAVPDPRMECAALRGAHQVLASLEEFDPAAWGLPPYTLRPRAGGAARSKE